MSNKQTVIFVVPTLRGGGGERSVLKTYQLLENQHNCECHIILFEDKIEHKIPDNLRIHVLDKVGKLPRKSWHRRTFPHQASQLIDDYISCNFPKNTPIFSNILLADRAMSLSKHNVFHIIRNSYSDSLLLGKGRYKKWKTIKEVNQIYKNHPLVFVSHAAKQSFNQNFEQNTPQHVIYNPIDIQNIRHLADANLVQDNLKKIGYILHVGRFDKQKRHDLLLEAFAASSTPYKLVLLGQGKLESQIKAQIKSLNIENRVELLGFNSNPYPFIKHAKALVLTSDFEGLPTVLVEATVLGTPIISTNCAGVTEVIGKDAKGLVSYQDVSGVIEKLNSSDYQEYISPVPDGLKSENIAMAYRSIFS